MKIATVNKKTRVITAIRNGDGHFEPDENHEHRFLSLGLTHLKVGDKYPTEDELEKLQAKLNKK